MKWSRPWWGAPAKGSGALLGDSGALSTSAIMPQRLPRASFQRVAAEKKLRRAALDQFAEVRTLPGRAARPGGRTAAG